MGVVVVFVFLFVCCGDARWWWNSRIFLIVTCLHNIKFCSNQMRDHDLVLWLPAPRVRYALRRLSLLRVRVRCGG
uniref:Putative secreted protein n=1 Tax=Anopheles triannulatus TaxID=58253 RepID=A0A2M4B0P3_9DIPT